jgi:TRAP-type mannitol/chloroaromatic compound transport system permease large subunit
MIRCSIQPHLAPKASGLLTDLSVAQKMAKLKSLILPALFILWVLGNIYSGIATVTEAAGVGALGAAMAAKARG